MYPEQTKGQLKEGYLPWEWTNRNKHPDLDEWNYYKFWQKHELKLFEPTDHSTT